MNFEGDLTTFTIDANGIKTEEERDIGCAKVKITRLADTGQCCIWWDITGCKFEFLGKKFELSEHGSKCKSY